MVALTLKGHKVFSLKVTRSSDKAVAAYQAALDAMSPAEYLAECKRVAAARRAETR